MAIYGMSLTFHDRAIPFDEWWTPEKRDRMEKRAATQHDMDGGHNKFLELIDLWIDIEAPRYWWQEFDTYRVGVSKESESSMYLLKTRDYTLSDFEDGDISEAYLEDLNSLRAELVQACSRWRGAPYSEISENPTFTEALNSLKRAMPEGFLQWRLVKLSYKNLRNIIIQRQGHVLPDWHVFIDEVYRQAKHPELLPRLKRHREGTEDHSGR